MTATPPPTGPSPSPAPAAPVTESDLLAYVDGRLDDTRRAEVEAHLLDTPDDAVRVAADLAIQQGLKVLFGQSVEDARPVPQRPNGRRMGRRTALAALLAAGGFLAGYGAGALEAAPALLSCLP